MGQIQVLSFEVANLIAAGEVVDRPASAIKEMMENAIDAGAKHITVEIQNGGVSLMRVTDDGCGMSAEDLPMAIRRHATSKIRTAEDLDGILSLGFRGEALAAISSVSDMRILSKRREDAVGSVLEVQGGTLLGVREYGGRDGTTVIVENLFANVPARRKFLKRDATEAMAVAANVERVALSHPEIAVRFISDGVPKLDTAGDGQLKSAIWAVFGKDFASKLLPLESEYEGIRISGFVGRSDNVKANRNGQNFFINDRFVRSRTAQAALEQAFVSYIPPEKFPCCVMKIFLNPARVDVNVHPAKLEVKFSNEKPVFEAVYYAVRQALEQNTTRPDFAPSPKKPLVPGGGKVSEATAPVELERPESLGKRQITMDMQPEKSAHAPQERISSEQFRRDYLHEDAPRPVRETSIKNALLTPPPVVPPPPPAPEPTECPSADAPVPELLPIDQIPMELYEEEARYLFGEKKQPEHRVIFVTGSSPKSPETVTSDDGNRMNTLADFYEETAERLPSLPNIDLPSWHPREVLTVDPDAVPPAEEPSVDMVSETVMDISLHDPVFETLPVEEAPPAPYRMVGEVFHSYVIVEQGDRMLLIDKHAAHERIIFEELKANMKDKAIESQLLMLPIEVMLMSDEVGQLDAYRPELEAVGFTYTCLRNTVRVDSIPAGILPGAVPDMIATIAEQLQGDVDTAKLTRDIFFEKALYQASCKAAIKAGREYAPEQIRVLVDKLMALPDITFCPHGRPVAMEMSKRTLDRQFERC